MDSIEHHIKVTGRRNFNFTLVPLGDIHVGNANLDLDRIERTIEFIRKTPNCFVLGMGDYAEAIDFKDDRADPNVMDRDLLTPDDQYEKVEELLTPIKGKILGLLDGNHDYKYWVRHNHNFVSALARNLGTKYTGFSAYVRIHIERDETERRTFNLYAHHGWSSSRSEGGAVNTIHDLHNKFPGLHLYLMGHTHRLGEALPKTTLYKDLSMQTREWVEKYVYTGSFFKGYNDGTKNSYVESRGYSPLMLGAPIIEIKPNRTDGGRDTQSPPFSMRISTDDWF